MENLKKQLLDTNWYVLVMNYCREESLLFMGFHINFQLTQGKIGTKYPWVKESQVVFK